jgi:hypothetical protein
MTLRNLGLAAVTAGVLTTAALTSPAAAQAPAPAAAGAAQAAPTPRAAAPIDITGNWVSLVADDWRWRMMTPPKGDILYLPVNPEGRKVAESWDPAKDEAANEQCKAYGPPGVMALPGRLRISWQDDTALKLETDNGTQTRLFQFGRAAAAAGEPTRQGRSVAEWEIAGGRRGGPGPRPGSSLKVTTTNMTPGYFRKNGVPYGANATFTEYYTVISEPDGNTYLNLTWFLEDPQYLTGPFIRTVHFKKEPDGSKWAPSACSAR